MRMIIREVNGQVPVVVSTGHTGTDVAVALSREAEAEGADGVMVLPPYYYKPDADGIFEYFRAIDEAVTIPIMIQDAPLMTQVAISPALAARMGRELSRVRYVKVEAPPTASKVTDIIRLADSSLTLFGGMNGQFLLEELDRGARGTMPGSDLTSVFVGVWNLWTAGRRAEARQAFARHLPLIRYELQPGLGVAVMKQNLWTWGVIASARVRHPTRALDEIARREVEELRRGTRTRFDPRGRRRPPRAVTAGRTPTRHNPTVNPMRTERHLARRVPADHWTPRARPWTPVARPLLALALLALCTLGARAQHPAPPQPSAEGEARIPRLYLNQSGFNAGKPKRFTRADAPGGHALRRPARDGGRRRVRGHHPERHRRLLRLRARPTPASTSSWPARTRPCRSASARGGSSASRTSARSTSWWTAGTTSATSATCASGRTAGATTIISGGNCTRWCRSTSRTRRPTSGCPGRSRYEPPADAKLWGALQPYRPDAPDIVKLMHWGADVIVTQGITHELLKSQLAYFLYAWPVLKDYLPAQNYAVVRDYAFAKWPESSADRKYPYDESDDHNLLALKTRVGTTKGAYPPGFSIEPNLLMYEVARRDGRADAERYFEAARAQAAWMVANLDWQDPLTTKGQRMSEFLTLTGLAHLLRQYPDRAPAGLRDKIDAWADVVIRRSENLWDFRKLDDGDKWTPMGEKPSMWNEPGNVVGFPAARDRRDALRQRRREAGAPGE